MRGAFYAFRDAAMDSDETHVLPKREKTAENVFEFGDRTILQMQNQDFEPVEEYGTMMQAPSRADAPLTTETVAGVETPASEDPLVRLEQKLDLAMRMIAAMQHKLESLDATLARLLMR